MQDLALNNQQWLICQKTKPNQTKPNQICSFGKDLQYHLMSLCGVFPQILTTSEKMFETDSLLTCNAFID